MRRTALVVAFLITALTGGLLAFGGSAMASGDRPERPVVGRAAGPDLFVLTADGVLTRRDGTVPVLVRDRAKINGLSGGDRLVGLDRRPANNALYALGRSGQLYTVDPGSGKATAVGSPVSLNGSAVGFDFNPTVDRIRVVTSGGQNLRLNPDNGAVAGTDTALAYAAGDRNAGRTPKVSAAGYTNSVAGATATTLYDIDTARDVLVTQGTAAGVMPAVSPNTGQLFTVGRLGRNVDAVNGFDISGSSGRAVASVSIAGRDFLARVDLETGRASTLGPIGRADVVGLTFAG